MNRYFFLSLFLVLTFSLSFVLYPRSISAQTSDLADLIQAHTRCAITDNQQQEALKETIAVPPTPMPAPIQATRPKNDAIAPSENKSDDLGLYQGRIKQHFKRIDYVPQIPYNGMFFYQNQRYKWGLRDSTGKVIIKPKFEYIKVDEAWSGFLGIEEKKGKLNFYKLEDKASFTGSYQYITPIESSFIVKNGYETLIIDKEEKTILRTKQSPSFYFIRKASPLLSPLLKTTSWL